MYANPVVWGLVLLMHANPVIGMVYIILCLVTQLIKSNINFIIIINFSHFKPPKTIKVWKFEILFMKK